MATVSITIPDPKLNEVLDAFDVMFPGREAQTKAQWVRLQVETWIKKVHLRARQKPFSDQSLALAIDDSIIG